MRRYAILFLLLLTGSLLSAGLPAVAQERGWTPPTDVSNNGMGWFPDVAVGPEGSVHVIWHGSVTSGQGEQKIVDDQLMYRELRNGKWSPINNIVAPGTSGYTMRNSIVLSRDGRLHVLVRTETSLKHFSAPPSNAWSAQGWSPLHTISGGGAYYNALGVDSKGTLHVLWSQSIQDAQNKTCPGCSDMFYRRSSDDGDLWSSPTNLSRTEDGENRPQIKIDRHDRIHVVWDQGVDWYAGQGKPKEGVYRRSDDGGTTWTVPVSFSLPDDAIQQIALALTSEDDPMVVYRSVGSDKLYYQVSTQGGDRWATPVEIPGVRARNINDPNLDMYSMATDSAGHVHLLMAGYRPGETSGSPGLLHLVWDGTTWGAPEVVMKDSTLYPEWPHIVVSGGNHLHAVWFTRNEKGRGAADAEGAQNRIWYSGKIIDTVASTALPLFTPTPTLGPTATPTPIPLPPTLVPLPPDVAQLPPLKAPQAWEGPGIVMIGLALLPLMGLFVFVSVISRWVRRRHR